MDPFIGGALISGATSLLGGLFGRNQAKKDLRMQRQLINEQNEYNNPTNIRKRAEEGGFNPLSFIGPGVGLQTQTAQVNSGNYMGAAIADAGMAFAGAMADKAKFQETKKLNDLEMANAKLQNKILQLTLRPKVEGIYAQRQSTPTIAAAVGGGNGTGTNGSGKAGSASPPDTARLYKNSPMAGAVVGPDDGNLTGVQHSVKKDVPAFRLFGHDFYGSGLFSTGQQIEDSVGESEIVAGLYAPVVVTDAFLNEGMKGVAAATGYIQSEVPAAGSYDPYYAHSADIARMSEFGGWFNKAASKARPDLGAFYDRPNMRHTVRPAPPVLKAVVPKKPKKAYDPRPLFHQWGVYSSSPGSF